MTVVFSNRALAAARLGAFACLLAGLTALTGCGKGLGTVTGTVTYKGKALTAGSVQIQSEAGSVHVGQIVADGTYTVTDVPAGPGKISISSMDPKFEEKMRELAGAAKPGVGGKAAGRAAPPTGGGADVDRAKYSLIPLKYETFDSGLTVEVKKGQTKHDIPLTD